MANRFKLENENCKVLDKNRGKCHLELGGGKENYLRPRKY